MELNIEQKRKILEDGYVVIPGLVPRPLIVSALRDVNNRLGRRRTQATTDYSDARDYWSDDTDALPLLDLIRKTGLWELAESLSGTGKLTLRRSMSQIALRFPSVNNSHGGPAAHVDGFYSPKENKPISRFTMLAGVLLSDVPDKYMGNLTVFPGTHRTIAEYIKLHGSDSLRSGLAGKIDLPEPVQITGKAGDAVLLHYQLAHDKEQNLSHLIRYSVYWRLWHVDSDACQPEGLTDIWREWPAIAALLPAEKNAPRKKKAR